jgi:5-methylcytosine-specific restriction protein A
MRPCVQAARAMKLCTVCGVATSRPGARCTDHARQSNRSRHNALYSARAWQRLSARVLRAWRGEHGNWCPGYARPAHPAADLTVDHVVPLAAGGAPFDIGNTAVLCRSCNSTKGASSDRGGVAHTATQTSPDRAVQSHTRGWVFRFFPSPDRPRPRSPTRATGRPRAAMNERMATGATRGGRAATQPPFGLYAQVDEIDGRLICHVCGRGYRWLPTHTLAAHGLPADEYRKQFGLARSASLSASDLRAQRIRETLRRQQIGMFGRYPKCHQSRPASAPRRGPTSPQTRRAMSAAHLGITR